MLKVENLGYRHLRAATWALDGLDFELAPGRALVICGRSGSGKSTLLSILSGLAPHYFKGELRGRVTWNGEEPRTLSLRDWGFRVGLMTQNPETQFLAGTVEEEIALTLRCRDLPPKAAREMAEERISRFGLDPIRGQSVFHLSEGQKQKVVLAGLTALRPGLLLLDEPTANLDPDSIEDLARTLKLLKDDGLTLVIADHRLYWLEGLGDRVLVLERGRSAAAGDWSVLRDEEMRTRHGLRAISARPAPPPAAPRPGTAGDGAVVLEEVAFAYPGRPEILSGLNMALDYGRVTVLGGPSGCGKTTLAKLLCGLERPGRGCVRFGGTIGSGRGLGQVVLQNADHQLYMPTVKAEIELPLRLHNLGNGCADGEAVLRSLGLAGLAERHPQSLSGGEKQRLVVAVGQIGPTKLLVLDEPTSGLDGHNLRLMAARIRQIAAEGPAVLVITHDLELAELCADTYLVLPAVCPAVRATPSPWKGNELS